MKDSTRGFSGKLGFVMSAAGSAVGLGNIWRFPYLAAENGGGIFLLVYIVVTLVFGFPIMAMEIAIGRKTVSPSIAAYGKLDKRGSAIGWLTAAVTLITLPYYCVIGGWVMKYTCVFLFGNGTQAVAPSFFSGFLSQSFEPLIWQLVFLAISALVLLGGIKDGIERANKILMPALIVLAAGVAVYSLLNEGALSGLSYYLKPDFSKFSFQTVLAATGQMFYSLSLSSGIMVTFGAYLGRNVSIEKSVKLVEVFDIGIAFLSGLIVITSVFAFSGGEQAALSAGAGLLFETMPAVFVSMPFGEAAGAVFFLLVLFATLSSAISMMEVNVANLVGVFGMKRSNAVILLAAVLFVLGLPSALGYNLLENVRPLGMTILDFADFIGNTVVTPIAALIACLFIGWVVHPRVLSQEIAHEGVFSRRKSFEFIIRWAAPVFIAAVMVGTIGELLA